MSHIYYTSLSGMLAASQGLQNTSNNIANMQNPGFKRSDLFYSSLGEERHHSGLGSGVYVGGKSINFSPGSYIESRNPLDLAIVGRGFFILKLKNGDFAYTRDGAFSFNSEGFLCDKRQGGLVQGYDENGALTSISKYGPKILAGHPSKSIQLKGEFIITEMEKLPGSSPEINQDPYQEIKFSLNVFDNQGKSHQVDLVFSAQHTPKGANNPTNYEDYLRWDLKSASCADAKISAGFQSIYFDRDVDGRAMPPNNTIKLTLNDEQNIVLNFGDYTEDLQSSVRLYRKEQPSHSTTKIEVSKQDGYPYGKQRDYNLDNEGRLIYFYDNGQTAQGPYLALADFENLAADLEPTQDNLFQTKHRQAAHLGKSNQGSLGLIKNKTLESSNVDSTTEFAHIVVLQRMFQACSQIMDIEKQLLEGLAKK